MGEATGGILSFLPQDPEGSALLQFYEADTGKWPKGALHVRTKARSYPFILTRKSNGFGFHEGGYFFWCTAISRVGYRHLRMVSSLLWLTASTCICRWSPIWWNWRCVIPFWKKQKINVLYTAKRDRKNPKGWMANGDCAQRKNMPF